PGTSSSRTWPSHNAATKVSVTAGRLPMMTFSTLPTIFWATAATSASAIDDLRRRPAAAGRRRCPGHFLSVSSFFSAGFGAGVATVALTVVVAAVGANAVTVAVMAFLIVSTVTGAVTTVGAVVVDVTFVRIR